MKHDLSGARPSAGPPLAGRDSLGESIAVLGERRAL